MIVPMKKALLLCLMHDRVNALEKLRELGVMHVETETLADTEDRSELQMLLSGIERAATVLESRKGEHDKPKDALTPKQTYRKVADLLDEMGRIDKDMEVMRRSHEALSPWGDFSNKLMQELADKGVNVYCCEGMEEVFDKLATQSDLTVIEIDREHGTVRFVVVTEKQMTAEELPLAVLPKDRRLRDIDGHMVKLKRRLGQINTELDKLAAHAHQLERFELEIRERLEFLTTRDSMQSHEQIASIRGFVPAKEEERLTAAAEQHGWALLLEEPAPDDRVPTLITIPKAFRFIQPLFEFLGISPGYNEIDASVGVMFFFVIYFGMIVGDAGYGSIFMLITLIARAKLRGDKYKLPLRLMGVLSASTMIWGGLSGNWFGLSAPGIEWLSGPAKNRNIQFFCFLLAVAQLSLGHIWRAILAGNIRKILGQTGWIIILWMNFFLTLELVVDRTGQFPGFMLPLYGAGAFLVATCDVNWRDPSEVFNLPFSFINSFVDMLSYIRLFAVGMAGFYIASSFNGMFASLLEAGSGAWIILAVVLGLVVILFGHLLNIALCMMGVLVHGVRLNTLEFSNHIGLTWSGTEFKPFKKNIISNKEK
ncbi:hypothetical protein P0136_12295 [Lentisphaerota bacterium ZTH]|nr:hypothetical protein JYG24_10190 [Lentisphaerota bacterium]WET06138.1 hypothetical protein P0136_12295 [Lentisphaerota bacterium ZTH]